MGASEKENLAYRTHVHDEIPLLEHDHVQDYSITKALRHDNSAALLHIQSARGDNKGLFSPVGVSSSLPTAMCCSSRSRSVLGCVVQIPKMENEITY